MNLKSIRSGSFTAAGNFTGYTVAGERIHIPARQMETAGYNKDNMPKFPFYTVSGERTFNVLDENGNATEEKFTREQAGSIFATKDEAIEAYNESFLLDIEAKASLKRAATEAGLAESLNAIIEASVA
jgi:hypothetical protein